MRLLRAGVMTAVVLVHVSSVRAGNGTIDFANHTMNLSLNLRFPVDAKLLESF